MMSLRGVHFLRMPLSVPSKQELFYLSLEFRVYEHHREKRESEHPKRSDRQYALGMTSSIFKGARLNGSFESESRCDLIVALSTTARDDGKVTGSFITVYNRPSIIRPVSIRHGTTFIDV